MCSTVERNDFKCHQGGGDVDRMVDRVARGHEEADTEFTILIAVFRR